MEGEADSAAVRADADVGVEEVVAGLLIPDGAFAAAGHYLFSGHLLTIFFVSNLCGTQAFFVPFGVLSYGS